MGLFERFLSLWVALAILLGIAGGHLLPGAFELVAMAAVMTLALPAVRPALVDSNQ